MFYNFSYANNINFIDSMAVWLAMDSSNILKSLINVTAAIMKTQLPIYDKFNYLFYILQHIYTYVHLSQYSS